MKATDEQPHHLDPPREDRRPARYRQLLAFVAALALLAFGCGDDDDDTAALEGDVPETTATTDATVEPADEEEPTDTAPPDGEDEEAAEPEQVTVDIVSVTEGFEPATITVPVGSEVTWVNTDQIEHTSTAEDDTWDSGKLAPGEEFSYTAEEPGTYPYLCSIHPTMTGELVVE